jgi:ABC-2 type transport system permease protein
MNLFRLFAVVDRDLKKFRRNVTVVGMSILMPILYLAVFGNSFQGKLRRLPLAVVNQDSGIYARVLMDNLRALQAGPATITIFDVGNETEALNGIRQGQYKAALVIPDSFSKNVIQKARPNIGLFLDNTDGISSEVIRGAVSGALASMASDYVPVREPANRTYLREIDLFKKVDYYQSLVPGVVIMAIFLGTLTTGAFNIVMDRFLGVDESYLLTPLSKMDIVAGLILSGLTITTIIASIILVVGMLMTGMSFSKSIGQYAGVLFIIILTTLSLLSLMFVILGRFKHPRIVGLLSGFMNVILFFPSGAVYPVASFPEWLKGFAKVNPEAYAVQALKALLFKGATLGSVGVNILFLLIFTGLLMTTAIMTFKRTL